MQTVRITTTQNIDIDYQVAALGDRVAASAIDYGIFLMVYYVFAIVMLIGTPTPEKMGVSMIVLLGVWLVLYILYDIVAEVFFNGQSIGKKITKIKVISLDGARPTLGQYMLRWVFRLIDFTLTFGAGGLLTIVLSENKQRIGDVVAGTTLVKTKQPTQFGDLTYNPAEADHEVTYNEANQLKDEDILLIQDVIKNFNRTRNNMLIYKLSVRIKEYLNVTAPEQVNDYRFLEMVVKDYNYLTLKNGL